MEDWTKKHRDALDAAMMKGLGQAVTSTSATAGETITVDKLKDIAAKIAHIPPPPLFASSQLFPPDGAIRFKWGQREYCGAHPDFWENVKLQVPEVLTVARLSTVDIIDLDNERNAQHRDVFYAHLALAMAAGL